MSSTSAVPGPEAPSQLEAQQSTRTPDLTHRVDPALLPEFMDEPCSYEQFRDCVRDIGSVNRWTFGYGPTFRFLNQVVATHPTIKPLRILDVGSGGGDALRRIARWAHRRKLPVELIGIDLNPHATRAAEELTTTYSRFVQGRGPGRARLLAAAQLRWITGDVFTHPAAQTCDIVLSSLVTHHMRDPEIVRFLRWQESTAHLGWCINDLLRSEKAFRFFRVFSKAMSWHDFVQHDGLVSIRRAFREPDWQRLLAEAAVPQPSVHLARSAPGRLCLTRLH